MPRGTPHGMKCPSCKRGKFGHPRQVLGVRRTGYTGTRLVKSATSSGGGSGAPQFHGYPGIVECLDCGHRWLSTHPRSGRVELRMGVGEPRPEPTPPVAGDAKRS